MTAQYLIRFDDICPTMNWERWEKIEKTLLLHNIKPILAIVPDNKDAKLIIDPPNEDFWNRARIWQEQGWTLALHGYQHLYETQNAGIMGINNYSEFSGLSYDIQREKLTASLAIFQREHIHIDTFVAPAHSFDEITVKILLELGINIISDGFYLNPVSRLGAVFIPQQLWHFRDMPFGLWTVCYHHNSDSAKQLDAFEDDIIKYKQSIIDMRSLTSTPNQIKPISLFDKLFAHLFLLSLKIKRKI